MQKAIIGKHAEVDPTVQQLPTAKPEISRAVKSKFTKTRGGQSGTRSPVQPGQETLLWLSMGSTRPRSRGSNSRTATSQKG